MLVFIHGESYEWNSGNPYDGRVLASNAELVVVTLNYRLGILGEANVKNILLVLVLFHTFQFSGHSLWSFSDDKTLQAIHSDPETALNLIRNHLYLLSIWYEDWSIEVNGKKSIQCTFILKRTDCSRVHFNDVPLQTSLNVRYLRLHLNRRLTWANHIHLIPLLLPTTLPSYTRAS